jgi:hypothetical protein
MVTARLCVEEILLEAGDTAAVGVDVACVTVTGAVPDALLYDEELALSGVYFAVSVSDPAASDPAGMVIAAEPELRGVAEEV